MRLLLFVGCGCSLFVVCCVLYDVCGLCCLLFVACRLALCLLFVDGCGLLFLVVSC